MNYEEFLVHFGLETVERMRYSSPIYMTNQAERQYHNDIADFVSMPLNYKIKDAVSSFFPNVRIGYHATSNNNLPSIIKDMKIASKNGVYFSDFPIYFAFQMFQQGITDLSILFFDMDKVSYQTVEMTIPEFNLAHYDGEVTINQEFITSEPIALGKIIGIIRVEDYKIKELHVHDPQKERFTGYKSKKWDRIIDF